MNFTQQSEWRVRRDNENLRDLTIGLLFALNLVIIGAYVIPELLTYIISL